MKNFAAFVILVTLLCTAIALAANPASSQIGPAPTGTPYPPKPTVTATPTKTPYPRPACPR